MTYKELKETATYVGDNDIYDNGIYAYTQEFYICEDGLYCHENHPNTHTYTGKTTTFQVTDIKHLKTYGENFFLMELGMSEECYQKIVDFLNGLPSWGGSREGAGRPSTGRQRKSFYVTEDEETKLRECLKTIRKEKEAD